MEEWILNPWSLQYLVGGVLSFLVSIYILYKNTKNTVTQYFFLFGLSIALWQILAFLHRNAPNADLSATFFRFDLFFLFLAPSFLLLSLLFLRKERRMYPAVLIPPLSVSIFTLFISPFKIISTKYGWSYQYTPYFGYVTFILYLGYILAIILYISVMMKETKASSLRKRYTIILLSFVIFYVIGLSIANALLAIYQNIPPLGGIFVTLTFIFIAYAITIPPEKIILPPDQKKQLGDLSKSYLRFLNAFQTNIPGRELGENSFRFQEYIEALGLKDVVIPRSGKLLFDIDKLGDELINEIPNNILKIIKLYPWATETVNEVTDVLVMTYKINQSKSIDVANDWFEKILHQHGGFLSQYGILDILPKNIKVPQIFKKLKGGNSYFLKEAEPICTYGLFKNAMDFGFKGLCFTKFPPEKVRERYEIEKTLIIWLTFKEDIENEKTIITKQVKVLIDTIRGFVDKENESIICIDCFYEVVMVNGFETSLKLIKDIKNICRENHSILLLSLNPKTLEDEQLTILEKEFLEVK